MLRKVPCQAGGERSMPKSWLWPLPQPQPKAVAADRSQSRGCRSFHRREDGANGMGARPTHRIGDRGRRSMGTGAMVLARPARPSASLSKNPRRRHSGLPSRRRWVRWRHARPPVPTARTPLPDGGLPPPTASGGGVGALFSGRRCVGGTRARDPGPGPASSSASPSNIPRDGHSGHHARRRAVRSLGRCRCGCGCHDVRAPRPLRASAPRNDFPEARARA